MATRVSKPEFNIRQKLSELDRPVGTNGSQLLKSADAAESFVLTQAGRRNLVINGNPIIYQRGQTATDHGVYVYATADRWRTSSNGSYTKTGQFNQEVVLDQSIPGIGGKVNYIKYTNTSAATNPTNASWGMNYRVENKDIAPYLGKVMTLSCYMKSDEGIEIRSGFISGTTSSSIPLVAVGDPNTYIALTPEWKRYTWTFTLGNTLPASHMDIGLRTQVDKAGSACYTCLQFEEGNVATPFEFRSIAEELALCQRYYQQIVGNSDMVCVGPGRCNGTTNVPFAVPLSVPLRASPSINSCNFAAFTSNISSSISSHTPAVTKWDANSNILTLQVSGLSGMTNARAANMFLNSGHTLKISSEL